MPRKGIRESAAIARGRAEFLSDPGSHQPARASIVSGPPDIRVCPYPRAILCRRRDARCRCYTMLFDGPLHASGRRSGRPHGARGGYESRAIEGRRIAPPSRRTPSTCGQQSLALPRDLCAPGRHYSRYHTGYIRRMAVQLSSRGPRNHVKPWANIV